MFSQLMLLCCSLAAVFLCGAHETANGSSVGQNHPRMSGNPATADAAESIDYLEVIFKKYAEDGVINMDRFRDLLNNVHLSKLVFDSVNGSDSRTTVSTDAATTPSDHYVMAPAKLTAASVPDSVQNPVNCVKAKEALKQFVVDPNDSPINRDKFYKLCPAILYEIDRGDCLDNHSQHHSDTDHHHHEDELLESDPKQWKLSTLQKYGYSSLAVLIISVTGMMTVAVVPILQRFYYQQLLQYLVALAVGSLIGDALLHLLPHAMREVGKQNSHSHSHGADGGHGHEHNSAEIWLGMTALGGICLFFVAERALNALNNWKKRRTPETASVRELEELKRPGSDAYNTYRYEGISEMNKGDAGEKDFAVYEHKQLDGGDAELNVSGAGDKHLLNGHDNRMALIKPKAEVERKISYGDVADGLKAKQFDEEDFTGSVMVVVSEHKSHHKSHGHTHSHSHSHSHAVPRTAMATAWMVIAGDGLHNFADGMAIGAAFAKSPTVGLSTAIAVFCHELPHELGDFALLLKAGMGIRQALFYNGLSSFLCFLGMVAGLLTVNLESANAWVFAGTAGMFLYLALVDMVPELNSETSMNSCLKFVLQALGIATGVTIMCLIAVYESELERYFGS